MDRDTELKVEALAKAIDNFLMLGKGEDYEAATTLSAMLLEIIADKETEVQNG